ncbi:heme NO-binding domain-containing protein [Terasakiella sp. A23]|uniref:heme NO-binding domain-containing protein n=1 Tax=Terasakiella sp. FCG-A23 TaxID=3080561 RepID=UPI00295502A4|nr:heme NO-binding domain-containing protein [Terasakiella sp. A23]MDV7340670.1 heme NO-binding domain-containing protein [Terasakiella sp. A23]
MLGVVFTEFLEMVEEKFSFDVSDKLLDAISDDHSGSFTAVGDYDHATLVKMVVELSKETNIEIADLIRVFGAHLFHQFSIKYPMFFEGMTSSLDFLEGIEDRIHTEVRKLYPNAELPTFDCIRKDTKTLEMNYSSVRPFGDLAHGLIAGCADHFKEEVTIQRNDIDGSNKVQFIVSVV